jgi:hypothetical protein
MILLSELSRRRIRSITKLIRVGRIEFVVVLRVDKEKGYIDLSKRRVAPEDVAKADKKYTKAKAVCCFVGFVPLALTSLSSTLPGAFAVASHCATTTCQARRNVQADCMAGTLIDGPSTRSNRSPRSLCSSMPISISMSISVGARLWSCL